MFNKTKILGIASALIFINFSSSFAETIVHTTRQYNRVNTNTAKKEITPRKPMPYSWEQAIDYANIYPEDITVHTIGGYKDKYGNFSKWRCIDFLGDQGLMNRGDSFWGRPSCTYLRLAIHYGQETNASKPFATIIWATDVNKRHQNDLNQNLNDTNADTNPKYIRIVFESGYEKEFSTDIDKMRMRYYSNFNIYDILYFPLSLFFATSVGDKRSGYILLTSEDIWDICRHGNIANVYLDDNKAFGMGTGQLSFFYSGDKQEEDKLQLTYGFQHLMRLLNINPSTLAYERKKLKEDKEIEYRKEVKNKLKEELKQDMLRKELMNEVREEVKEEIRLGRKGN